eukprot:10573819-Lingulodinium_polyedra.AAC.1
MGLVCPRLWPASCPGQLCARVVRFVGAVPWGLWLSGQVPWLARCVGVGLAWPSPAAEGGPRVACRAS